MNPGITLEPLVAYPGGRSVAELEANIAWLQAIFGIRIMAIRQPMVW